MNSFYKLYEHIIKEKLYIESIVSEKIRSLKDALQFIGSESQMDLSNLIDKKLSRQDFEIIKSAYKKLMFKWHPDRMHSQDPETKQNSKEYAVAANFAFEKLEKAFQDQTSISSSPINTSGNGWDGKSNWDAAEGKFISIEDLKERLEKQLKYYLGPIQVKLEGELLKVDFEMSPKTHPKDFEGLAVNSSFNPFFHVFIESNTKEWEAKIILYNKANDQTILEHSIKKPVKERESGILMMVADYYDNIGGIFGFIHSILKRAINLSPLEYYAKRIREIEDVEVKAKGNTLSMYFTNNTGVRQLFSMDENSYWPQLNYSERLVSSSNHDKRYKGDSTFVPKKLYLVMNLYEDKMNLSLSDSTIVNTYTTVPLTGLYDKKEENWLRNIFSNQIRTLIYAMKKEYRKIELENLKDRKFSSSKTRGLTEPEQKEYENIKQDSNVEVSRIG